MKKVFAYIVVSPLVLLGVFPLNVSAMHRHPCCPMMATTVAYAPHRVSIANFAFRPANIKVRRGATVTWTNHDTTSHTVTETDGSRGPRSGILGAGKSYSFAFNMVGTFRYHCAIHPNMTGTVIVTN